MTPPHNLTLYATDNKIDKAALDLLVNSIPEIDGVMADKKLAECFAEIYSTAHGMEYLIDRNQRIYELTEVSDKIENIGKLRPIREQDLSFLPYWIENFYSDCFGGSPEISADFNRYSGEVKRRVYVLEDNNNTAVCIAKITREMQNVCGIGLVYTPPYFRGKGYATSCVAQISKIALERGFSKCVLYTDLANPTSNSIYQKIGYNPICDSLVIKFKKLI